MRLFENVCDVLTVLAGEKDQKKPGTSAMPAAAGNPSKLIDHYLVSELP